MKHSTALNPQQHVEHLIEQKLIVCKKCRFAIWLSHIQKHFQRMQHQWKQSTAVQLIITIQSWFNIIANFDSLTVFDFVTEIVLELLVYDDELRCQVVLDQCYYVCRIVKSMKEYCREAHNWTKHQRRGRLSKNRHDDEQIESWMTIRCQRYFVQSSNSHYFIVENRVSAARSQSANVILVWQQAEQTMNDAWQTTKKKIRRMITKDETSEMNSWLKRVEWHRYLIELNREELIHSIARLDEKNELISYRIWVTFQSMTQQCQKTATSRVSNFVRMKIIWTKKHQIKYHSLQSYQNAFSFEDYMRAWQTVLMIFTRFKEFKKRRRSSEARKMLKYRFSKRQR